MGLEDREYYSLRICLGYLIDRLIDRGLDLIARDLCSGYLDYFQLDRNSKKKTPLLYNSDKDTLGFLREKMRSIFKEKGLIMPLSFSQENLIEKSNLSKLESSFWLIDITYFLKHPPKNY